MARLVMFHGRECPHCKKMMPLVEKLEQETPVRFEKLEVWHDEKNADLMRSFREAIAPKCGEPAPRPDLHQHGNQGRRLRRGRLRKAQGVGAEAGLAPASGSAPYLPAGRGGRPPSGEVRR